MLGVNGCRGSHGVIALNLHAHTSGGRSEGGTDRRPLLLMFSRWGRRPPDAEHGVPVRPGTWRPAQGHPRSQTVRAAGEAHQAQRRDRRQRPKQLGGPTSHDEATVGPGRLRLRLTPADLGSVRRPMRSRTRGPRSWPLDCSAGLRPFRGAGRSGSGGLGCCAVSYAPPPSRRHAARVPSPRVGYVPARPCPTRTGRSHWSTSRRRKQRGRPP